MYFEILGHCDISSRYTHRRLKMIPRVVQWRHVALYKHDSMCLLIDIDIMNSSSKNVKPFKILLILTNMFNLPAVFIFRP